MAMQKQLLCSSVSNTFLRVTVIVEWGRDLEPRDRNKEKEFLAISSISEPTNEIWNAFFANCN